MKRSNIKHFATLGAILIALVLIASTVVPSFIGISFGQVAEAVSQIDSYYSSLDTSKTGSAFRADLYDLIKSTHTKETTYDGLREVYKTADADPNKKGNIILFYTGTSVAFSGSFQNVNREHVWPKDAGRAFPAESKAGSDAHHLRPCDQVLNSTRGSKSFDIVPQTTNNIVKQNGSTSYGNLCYTSGNFFYPGEGYRGATARILFYVQTRWGDEWNLKFVDSAGECKTIGKISTLLQWHLQEPPTAEEIRRNEVIFGIQGNRNPFIDHPEYATQIYCYDGQSYNTKLQEVAKQYGDYEDTDVESITLSPSSLNIAVGQSAQISAAVSPSGANKAIEWTSSNKSVATVDGNGKVTALSGGYTTIIATSKKTPSVKATLDVIVKSVTGINISGNPVQTSYYEGDTFNPQGLTVTATYSDGSTGTLTNEACTWLDAGTKLPTLSKGTTGVICKVGGVEQQFNGIVVNQAVGKTETFNRSSFNTTTNSYGWNTWSSGTIEGQAFMYPGRTDSIQMNNSQQAYYIFNTTPIPGQLISITIKAQGTKDWEIRTSTTPYDSTASGYPKTGTSHGIQSATSDGTTWTLNTSDPYFTINYLGSKATYIDSITISFGGSAGEDCEHSYTSVVTPPTCSQNGYTTHTCSKCGNSYMDNYVDALGHQWSDWSVKTPATCTASGLEERVCQRDGCGHKETRVISALGHSWGEWHAIDEDTEEHTCSVCGHSETRAIGSVDEDVERFINEVNAIGNATSQSDKFNAIKTALATYQSFDQDTKALVAEHYATLSAHIEVYNNNVDAINKVHSNATQSAMLLLGGSISAFAAILYLLRRTML